MKNHIRLYIAGGLSIAFALAFYFRTAHMKASATFLPNILIGLIILLSIGMMVEGYYREKKHIKLKRRIDERSEEDEQPEEDPAKLNIPRVIIFIIMIASYIFLLKPVGYFIMTPIFAIITYLYLKATKIKNIIFIAFGFTAFVYIVFVAFLKIPIPMGILQ